MTASIRHLGDLCLVYSASPTEVGQSQIIKNQDKINTAYNSMKARLVHFMELTKKEKEYEDAVNEVQLAENEVKDALEKSNALLAKTRLPPATPRVASLGTKPKRTKESKETKESKGAVSKSAKKKGCLLYTSPSPRDRQKSRMPSSA